MSGRRRLALLGLWLILVGLNLRTVFSSFSAVLSEVRGAAGLPDWSVTVLTTAPVACLGIFAPLAPPLARRFGAERVLLAATALLTLGLLVRPTAVPGWGTLPSLLFGTAVCGFAIALGNVLLPGLVKRDFPHRLGLMSGLYTTAIAASAALAAGLTYPVLSASGSWQLALGFWALPAAAVAVAFAPLAWAGREPLHTADDDGPRLTRDPIAWHVTLFMVAQAMMSFSVFAWLSPILRERGVDGTSAGLIASFSIVLQMAGSLVAPAIAARLFQQSALNAVVALLTGSGFALCIVGPLGGVWLWSAMLGVGQGALTALALTMAMLRTRDAGTAARLSGMMQGFGYGLGSTGTLLVAQLHAAAGSFAPVAALFGVVGLCAAVFGALSGRRRFVGHASAAPAPRATARTAPSRSPAEGPGTPGLGG
ncbi:MFS transporter [Sinomonas gamaensis]|uniref:MFS transporter n=1 Tax=Sinomonas gamaensis TaxID=2565624 RepID=UPI0011092512|nr:MFS transporter [Sinomonas gamaensis]